MDKHTPSPEPEKGIWQFQEAKAKLSYVMDKVKDEGLQTVVRNREEVYYIVKKETFDNLTEKPGTLVEFFEKSPLPEFDLDIERSKELSRHIEL